VRLLVTNDDGIEAIGLRVLAGALVDAGHEAVVVAPDRDCSGQGAAIGPLHLTGTVRFTPAALDGSDVPAFAVDGPPALTVMAACLGGFGPAPEMIVSGINAGANTGRAVLHSGTVGAALTALNMRRPALAVSQAAGDGGHWRTAAALAVALVDDVSRHVPPAAFSLNVPNRQAEDVQGVMPARLDPGGRVQAVMVEGEPGVLHLQVPALQPAPDDTDTALLDAGYATLTMLSGPSAVDAPDLNQLCWRAERILPNSGRRSA
jgi:5'-nucleotidase